MRGYGLLRLTVAAILGLAVGGTSLEESSSVSSVLAEPSLQSGTSQPISPTKRRKAKSVTSQQSATPTPSPTPTLTPTPVPTPTRIPEAPRTGVSSPAARPSAASRGPSDPLLIRVANGFSRPILVTHAGDGSDRLFIVQQDGQVKIIKNGQTLATPYLDLRSLVTQGGGERGLLSLAFHPNYSTNGIFFIWYTALATGDNTLARYTVAVPSADVANVTASAILIAQPDREGNHNGGMLAFDRNPDPSSRYLYLSIGDEGSGGDPYGNGQRLDTIFGKILRLDVNATDPGLEYRIPPTNPFYGTLGARKEIWAYGLRNPWRWSFDRANGDMYIGDVGQRLFEEVNYQPAGSSGGQNYGWNIMEARSCFNPLNFQSPLPSCAQGGLTLPVLDYDRTAGDCSVTGGYVYRGTRYPGLLGTYLYGDYCTGFIYKTQQSATTPWVSSVFHTTGDHVTTFGEDEAGEVYAATLDGNIYRLAQPACSPRPNVQVTAAPGQPGELWITVSPQTNSNTPDNQLFSLSFTQTDNIVIDIGSEVGRTAPFSVSFPVNTAQTIFRGRRPPNPPPGLGSTAHFTAEDVCGSWGSFAGGGPGAF